MSRVVLLALLVGLVCLHDPPQSALGRQVIEPDVKQAPPVPNRIQGAIPGFPAGPQFQPNARPGMGDTKELVASLLESVKDADTDVRLTAAATLVHLGHDAVPALQEQLKAKEREARANAAYLLGQIGPSAQDAMPALLKALKDEDREVRRRAAFAVHNIVRQMRGGMHSGMPGMPGMMGGGMRPGGAAVMNVPDPGLLMTREAPEPQVKDPIPPKK